MLFTAQAFSKGWGSVVQVNPLVYKKKITPRLGENMAWKSGAWILNVGLQTRTLEPEPQILRPEFWPTNAVTKTLDPEM